MSRPMLVQAARGFVLALLLLTVACAGPEVQIAAPPVAVATAAPTVAPVATVALLPTQTPAAEPAQAAVVATPTVASTETPDWTKFAAQEGDHYVLGNPNAPIRLIDYSDFL